MGQAIAKLGLTASPGRADGEVYLWPENVAAWGWWLELQTQWRSGMGGHTGLDYSAALAYLREVAPNDDERREAFDGIRACERATLDVWAEQREREQAHER